MISTKDTIAMLRDTITKLENQHPQAMVTDCFSHTNSTNTYDRIGSLIDITVESVGDDDCVMVLNFTKDESEW